MKKVAIVTENTDYGISAAKECEVGLGTKGIDSVTFGVDIGIQDLAGIVERLKAENPDYIIVLLTDEADYNFTQQATDAGTGPQDIIRRFFTRNPTFRTNIPPNHNNTHSPIDEGPEDTIRRSFSHGSRI